MDKCKECGKEYQRTESQIKHHKYKCSECVRKIKKRRPRFIKAEIPQFIIEDNIPVTPSLRIRGGIYGFLERMEIGQSVFLGTDPAMFRNISAKASYYGKRHNKVFAIRKLDTGGWRIWRVQKDES